MGSREKNSLPIRVISLDLDDTIWSNVPVIRNAHKLERTFLSDNYPEVFRLFEEDPKIVLKCRERVVEEHPDHDHDFNFIRRKSFYYLGEIAGMNLERIQEMVTATFEIFDKERQNVVDHIYPGVLDTLRALKSNDMKLIALTNGTADIRRIPVLNEIFDHHFSAISAGALKPHPAPFEQMATAANVDKSQILHVGDNLIDDVQGAANFGIKTVWVHEKLSSVEMGHRETNFLEESLAREFHVGSIPSVAHLKEVLDVLT